MTIIEKKTLDEERALYGSRELIVRDCRFEGAADGESAFKECADIVAEKCRFDLRYPFWHNVGLVINSSEMTENCRAALWYSRGIAINDTAMHGIKAFRECSDIKINNCEVISPEFGWFCSDILMSNTSVESEYFMMGSQRLDLNNVTFHGKYSFQYIEDSVFDNCVFDTKDAFWHSKNVTVKNSVIRGEYLAWYSESLTLINCKISGTQPFCYCENLTLVDCEMTDTDLAFEKSSVTATITTPVISIKNPKSGTITVPSVGEIISDDAKSDAKIIIREC